MVTRCIDLRSMRRVHCLCRQNICTCLQFLDHGGYCSFNAVKYSWSYMYFTLKLIVSIISLQRENLGRSTDAIYLKMYSFTLVLSFWKCYAFSSSVPVHVVFCSTHAMSCLIPMTEDLWVCLKFYFSYFLAADFLSSSYFKP